MRTYTLHVWRDNRWVIWDRITATHISGAQVLFRTRYPSEVKQKITVS